MTKIEKFYGDILPPTGNYYLAYATPDTKLQQKKFSDRDSLIAAITLLSTTPANIYHGTASYGSARTLKETQLKKCYYLDVDCGEGKVYDKPSDALRGVFAATAQHVLPPVTHIVKTGNGLHFYWALEEAIPKAEWDIGARNLKTICMEHELGADNAITADAARIMRAPGSSNVKDIASPKSCELIYSTGSLHGAGLFQPEKIEYPAELVAAVGEDDLTNLPYEEVPCFSRGIFEKCGVFQRSLIEGGANDSEPLWNNILNTLSFAEDGTKFIHGVSAEHRGYSEGDILEKYEQKVTGSTAPTTCQTIRGLDNCGAVCAECPHKVTSPLHLGRQEPKPVEVIVTTEEYPQAEIELPDPYSIGADGLRRRTGTDEEGRPKFEPVLPPNFSHQIVVLLRSADIAHEHVYKLVLLHNEKTVEIPFLEELHDQKAWDKKLGEKGIIIASPFNGRFRGFIVAWLQELQKGMAGASQKHMGWADDLSSFGVGDQIYVKGEGSTNHMVDAVMRDKYIAVGELDEWRDKANKVIQDRPQSAAIIASSFAAPLIGFTGDPGCVFSIHGESGTGKTTIMKIAQAVWGHPVKGMMSLDDTVNSMLNSLGVMRNLPAYWDEVRSSKEDDRMMQIVFRLTSGRERTRLNANIQQRSIQEWQTILVTSSNISALGTIASQTRDSDAGIMRVFETTMPDIENSLGDLKVTRCYGAAGREFAIYLSTHTDEVRKLVSDAEAAMKLSLGATEPERFRVSLLAAMVVGAQLATKILGLKFDMASLIAFLKQEFIALRSISKSHRDAYSMENLVLQFINEMTPNRLVTDRLAGKGKSSVQMITFPRNAMPIYVHIAQSGECLLNKPKFDEWVELNIGIKGHKIKDEMKKLKGAYVGQRTLGAGTSMATGRGYVYGVNMADAGWCGVFDSLYQPLVQTTNVAPINP